MISLILGIAVLGFIVYLITTYIPMPAPFKTIIYVIVAIILILYIINILGVGDLPIPRLRN